MTGAKGYQILGEQDGGLTLAKMDNTTVRIWMFSLSANSISIQTSFPYLITPYSFVSRGNCIVAITAEGQFLLIRTSFNATSNFYTAFKKATRFVLGKVSPEQHEYKFLGVDERGVWVKPMTRSNAYGNCVTGEVVRITF